MEKSFKEALTGLNENQRRAVENIDGPVLVVAGPGTGKTQLIGTRVGYILNNTDMPADSILLLTFTEAGVQAMRERLIRMLGSSTYDVQLSTYHAFGGEIFRRYPDYLDGQNLTLLEDLGADAILRNIIASLPYSDPLKFADNYIGDVKSFISDSKQALLKPEDIQAVAEANIQFISNTNREMRLEFQKLALVNKKSLPTFRSLESYLDKVSAASLPAGILPLVKYAQDDLKSALDYFEKTQKTSKLTDWKRRWLARDSKGNLIIDGRGKNEKLQSAARVYRRYQQSLEKRQLYDYDDMILRAIDILENNPELKYSLAERYSYIMLDEFQDTNTAQFKLVKLLTDHPVHEGRPNILAVGDDDQAIYAFQGADHANMYDFAHYYKDVLMITLNENYRSTQDILDTAEKISAQINSRLAGRVFDINKDLTAENNALKEQNIELREFKSDAAQYDWVASETQRLIKKGVQPQEIAILAPKHRYLSALIPYLTQRKIKIFYERRENILDEPLIRQLEQMSKLVIALAEADEPVANSLWPEILSYDFWQVATQKIWQTSWESRESREPWTALMLNDETLNHIAVFFLRLAAIEKTATMEQQLDALVGWPGSQKELSLPTISPLYEYQFSKSSSEERAEDFMRLISQLNILRSKLRDWRQTDDTQPVGLHSFVEFIEGHRAAKINILNTSPYHESTDSINLMTAYASKGKEFQNIFIISAVDEIWGNASRSQGYRLSLPANLSYIRYRGANEDERMRLLYVAITRAKSRLYFTAYLKDLAGKNFNRLKYLKISEKNENEAISEVLPDKYNRVKNNDADTIGLSEVSNYWTDRHVPPFSPTLKEYLAPKLKNFKLSPTYINHFLNIIDHGPEEFFIKNLLNFPTSPKAIEAFGSALHNTLRFGGNMYIRDGRAPELNRLIEIFDAQLDRYVLPRKETVNLKARGHASLKAWLDQSAVRLKPNDRLEYGFNNDNVHYGLANLTGVADRLEVDENKRTVDIIDYKTGRSYSRWHPGVIKLHFFEMQLKIYKLLVENSARYKGYWVRTGIIEFVEPDEDGQIIRLELAFNDSLDNTLLNLLNGVWQSIQSLDFPDTSGYPKALSGIKEFESDLIKKYAG